MKQRIQKLLAGAGIASRRHIEQMLLEGRIAVNGVTVRRPPVLIDPRTDRVTVDGQRVRLAEAVSAARHYFLLNKPKGVYCTNVAQGEQLRAIDLLPPDLEARLYPVGRLDADSKGLLLLTDDGELTHRLTHPRYGVAKTYRAVVDGLVNDEAIRQLQKGVWLADREGRGFKTGHMDVKVMRRVNGRSILQITIREGRNRQVRRVLARLGHKVRDLTRIRMGPLTLEGLAPGQFRPLSAREVEQLKKAAATEPRGRGERTSPRRNDG